MSAKFGPGAIGRIGTIAMSAMVVLAVPIFVLAFSNPYIAGLGLLLICGIAIYTLHQCFKYANAHPVVAALDGAQMTRVLQQQASMRSLEGLPPPPSELRELVQNPLAEGQEAEK